MVKKLIAPMIFLLVLMISACTSRPVAENKAPDEIIDLVIQKEALTSESAHGLLVYSYPTLLKQGTVITPYDSWTRKEENSFTCESDCWFFWIDDDPLAQFAHETRYVIVDAVTKEVKVWKADWWPVINDEVVWGTTDERNRSNDVVYKVEPEIQLHPEWTQNIKVLLQGEPGCESWAILVCGSNDPGNTFDEDVRYWYDVLTGLGYDDDHIYYISPFTSDPGVDRETNLANVQWAVDEVAANSDAEDKVFLFYSAHGDVDTMQCNPGASGGGNISATDMDGWLDSITSRDTIVMLQGCRTGSFIGRYSDGSEVAAENDLTGNGESNRIVMTATDTDHSSYGADAAWGSSFAGGYIAAFSDAAADVDSSGSLSVNEGFDYALAHDTYAIGGFSFPQLESPVLDPKNEYHVCSAADAWISDGPNDIGNNSFDYDSTDIWSSVSSTGVTHEDPVSGLTNYIHVRVNNLGSADMTNVDVNLYWANSNTALAWPADFNQIGTTYTIPVIPAGANTEYTWPWFVDPAFGYGHGFCLVATADTAADPMSPPPGVTYVAPYDNNIAQKNIDIVETQAGQSAQVKFDISNPTDQKAAFDLIIDRSDFSQGQLWVTLPDKLMQMAERQPDAFEGLELTKQEGTGERIMLVTAEKQAVLHQILFDPKETNTLLFTFLMPKDVKVGSEFTIHVRQMSKEEIVGVNSFQIKVVPPGDCLSNMKQAAEVFAQIAFQFKSDSAGALLKKIGEALINEICQDPEKSGQWLKEAFVLEQQVGRELQGQVSQELLGPYLESLTLLNKALKKGSIQEIMLAQQGVVQAATKMVE